MKTILGMLALVRYLNVWYLKNPNELPYRQGTLYLKVPVGMVPSWCKVPGQLCSVPLSVCLFHVVTRNDPGTVTIPQYLFNKTKQHTYAEIFE